MIFVAPPASAGDETVTGGGAQINESAALWHISSVPSSRTLRAPPVSIVLPDQEPEVVCSLTVVTKVLGHLSWYSCLLDGALTMASTNSACHLVSAGHAGLD